MRSATWITAYAGVLVGGAYVVGSLVQLRVSGHRQHPEPSPEQAANEQIADDRAVAQRAVAEGFTAAVWASFAYLLIDRQAPGTSSFRDFSAIGFLSPKALTVWESVALWAGLGTVCGFIAPLRLRAGGPGFERGSTGLAGAGALVLLYTPITFFITVFAWFGAQALLQRRAAVLVALTVALGAEWLLSIIPQTVIRTGWGIIHGPESTLWIGALAGAIAARQSHEPRQA